MNIFKFASVLFLSFLISHQIRADVAATESENSSERLSLDRGWLFHEGDIPFPVITGHSPSYDNAKAGRAWGAAAPDYDDSDWKTVNLPHDWAVEQPFDPNANLSQGYRARHGLVSKIF